MSNLAISHSNQALLCIPQKDKSMKCEAAPEQTQKTFTDTVKDQVNIDRGLLPLGKGALIGGAAGALTGAGLAATLSHNMVGVFGDLTVGGAAKAGGLIGGMVGTATGAVSANFIDNKAINVALGAVAGGVASGAMGAGWLLGGLAGAVGAYAGTTVIQKQ